MAYTFGAAWLETALTDLATALGTDWEIQGGSDSGEIAEHAQARDRRGDVLFSTGVVETAYNKRNEYTANFICTTDAQTVATEVILGGVGYGSVPGAEVVATQVTVSQQGGEGARRSTLSITLHHHTGQSASITHSDVAYTITLPLCGFGIVEAVGVNGTIPENLTSYTFSAAIKHVDTLDNVGAFLGGDSTDCRLDITVDSEDTVALAAATGWAKTGAPLNASNTAYKTGGLAAHKFQVPDAP